MATAPSLLTTFSRTARAKDFEPRGAALAVFTNKSPEVLLAGPAGTGKSRAALEKLHLCASKYAGMRGLILRKTRRSLTQAAMVTLEKIVLDPVDGVQFRTTEQEYRYPNGSAVIVAGLDKASKVMSQEYDVAYVQEATELTEDDWESLTTRLRNGVMPYQQLLADCNPDAPSHWLKHRADRGAVVMLESRHEDNPALWDDETGDWTDFGRVYIDKLDSLTGVRYQRLRLGRWAAAEGIVYEGWDRAIHLLNPFPIPTDWPRYWAIDFGYTHAFICQWWAEDPDGRLYRYREIYKTQRLVEDHARDMLDLSKGEPKPRAIICDHDAEGRATLERHLGMKTTPAKKTVQDGIQAVAARLRPAGDGRPRLFLVRDAVVERDPALDDAKRPCSTEEEFDGYVWDTRAGRKKGEEPVKENDHGLDALRYMVAHQDLKHRAVMY